MSDMEAEFKLLLNRFEFAAQADKPASADYAGHRLALLTFMRSTFARLEAAEKDAVLWRWWCSQIKGVRTAEGSPYFSFPRLTPAGNIMRGSVYQHFEGAVRAAMTKEPT